MSMQPRVSVVMAVRNGGDYLHAALESLQAQSFADFELIVIDDGSEDVTAEILNSWPDQRMVRMRNPQGLGLAASLNRGLLAAKGEYIARQDADDLAKPSRLQRQVAFLDANPNIALVGCSYDVIDAKGRTVETQNQPADDSDIRWQMLFHNAFCHTSIVMRRMALVQESLLYDETLTYAQDYDLWSRLLTSAKAANLMEPLVGLRLHSDSMSARSKSEQQVTADLIAARNIAAALGKNPDIESVRLLRAWYYGLPARLQPDANKALSLAFSLLRLPQAANFCDMWVERILRHRDSDWASLTAPAFQLAPVTTVKSLAFRLLGRTSSRPERVRAA